jgi:hypothetical protein
MAGIQLLIGREVAHGAAAKMACGARHATTKPATDATAQTAGEATGQGQRAQPEHGGNGRHFYNVSRIHVDLQLWPRQIATFTRYNERRPGFLPYAASHQS